MQNQIYNEFHVGYTPSTRPHYCTEPEPVYIKCANQQDNYSLVTFQLWTRNCIRMLIEITTVLSLSKISKESYKNII